MTGFGSAVNSDFTVEIRSLNHRYVDIVIKIPSYLSQHEMAFRNVIKEKFQRGRFDVTVAIVDGKSPRIKINKEMAKQMFESLQELQKELSIPGTLTVDTIASFRELFIEENTGYNVDALYQAFEKAVLNLKEMRIQEGKILIREICERINTVSEINKQIRILAPDAVNIWREKFTERLSSILGEGIMDNMRIMQEAAIMAEKLDISEEINRIESHIGQFKEISNKDNAVGKKLDFLLQEIVREVNTLSYKSNNYSISRLAVEMKTELEKIREQVQNIQ